MIYYSIRGTMLLVFSIDLHQITGGSILNAVVVAGAIAAAAAYAVRSIRRDNAETASQAINSYKNLYEATLAELSTERSNHAQTRDSAARALVLEQESHAAVSEALEEAQRESHRLELVIKDRQAEIAALRAMPDTQQMLGVFEGHHSENQSAMRAMIENQSVGLDELRKVGEGITRLLDRNRPQRTSDPPRPH